MKKPEYKKNFIIPLMLVGCLGTGSAGALITHAFLAKAINSVDNVITAGAVRLNLTETKFDQDKTQNLIPPAAAAKNPCVRNTGKNSMWTFLGVDIPVRTVSLVGEDHRKLPEEATELFTFTPDTSWILTETTQETDHMHYVYMYQDIVGPGEMTTELFQEVKLKNILEGEIAQTDKLDIQVKAYAIQTGLVSEENGEKNPQEIYNELKGAL